MKRHLFACAAFAALVLGAAGARAEPGPKVNLLMDTPASLFSFGLFKADERLRSMIGFGSPIQFVAPLTGMREYSTSVYYDWDKNRLILSVIHFDDPAPGWDQEAECAQVIQRVRTRAGIDVKTGKPYPIYNGKSGIADQFLPVGYSMKKLEGVGEDLDEIIEVHFQSGLQTPFECTAPLLGTSYSVQR